MACNLALSCARRQDALPVQSPALTRAMKRNDEERAQLPAGRLATALIDAHREFLRWFGR